jgi:ubiquinone biosynthesis protein Coq4
VSALGQNEVLCYLSYEIPYLGPEGVKSGRPTQAVGHMKQNAFKFKIAQQKQKPIYVFFVGKRLSPLSLYRSPDNRMILKQISKGDKHYLKKTAAILNGGWGCRTQF